MTQKKVGKDSRPNTAYREISISLYFWNKAAYVTYVNDLLRKLDHDGTSRLTMTTEQVGSEDSYVLTITIDSLGDTYETMSKKLNALSSI